MVGWRTDSSVPKTRRLTARVGIYLVAPLRAAMTPTRGTRWFITDPSIVDRASTVVDVVPDNAALSLVSPLTASRRRPSTWTEKTDLPLVFRGHAKMSPTLSSATSTNPRTHRKIELPGEETDTVFADPIN